MKYIIPILILSAGLLPKPGLCQLNNGGLYANFGVDADTRSNWMKYGLVTGAISSDDWFAPSGTGYNVIDTTNAATYLALLQAGDNFTFNKRMSAPLYAKLGGTLWLDAVYGRDYQAAAQDKDTTTFTMAAKNGDNPGIWTGGVSNVPDKNDLVDVYAHMRRSGLTVYDSLWISNYSTNATLDTTYSTPWGTGAPSGGADWSAQYLSQQFIEVGLNLTRIGVDPALYSGLSPCQPLFSDIFFKSRSSNSFTADLKDFVTPMIFTQTPVMDYSLQGDTIRCNNRTAAIKLTNNSTAGYYTWQTLSGTVSGANGDSSQLSITSPGTFIVSASPAQGCPPTRVDTIVVPIDTFPPVASAFPGLSGNMLALYGGNVAASNSTPFGGSQGLTFSWNGPDGFFSTQQDPLTDTVWGTYHLTVTEKRNGCTDTASTTVVASMFIALLANDLMVNGTYHDGDVSLHWSDPNAGSVTSYVVEQMDASSVFQPIGTVAGGECLCFVDAHPLSGEDEYRVEAVSRSGSTYYSAVVAVSTAGPGDSFYLAGGQAEMNLVGEVSKGGQGALVVYDATGQTLLKRNVWLSPGNNTIAQPSTGNGVPAVRVVGLFMGGRLVFSGKGLW